MSRRTRRLLAAFCAAAFLAQAGDGVMAALCPPDEHFDLPEGDIPGEVTSQDHVSWAPAMASANGVPVAPGPGNPDDEGGDGHDDPEPGHCCPMAYGNGSPCTATAAASAEAGEAPRVAPAPWDWRAPPNEDLPPDPFLTGLFRPPCT